MAVDFTDKIIEIESRQSIEPQHFVMFVYVKDC